MKKLLLLTCVFAMFFSCSQDKAELLNEDLKEASQLTPKEIGALHNTLVAAYFEQLKESPSKSKSSSKIDRNAIFSSICSDLNQVSKEFVKTSSTKSTEVVDVHPLNSSNLEIVNDFYEKGLISGYLHSELVKVCNLAINDPLLYMKTDFGKDVSKEEFRTKEIVKEIFLASYQYWNFEHDYSKITKSLKMDDDYAIVIADCIGGFTPAGPIGAAAFSLAAIWASKQPNTIQEEFEEVFKKE
jgi:hypothetical protein